MIVKIGDWSRGVCVPGRGSVNSGGGLHWLLSAVSGFVSDQTVFGWNGNFVLLNAFIR